MTKWFRIIGRLEAMSFLILLFLAMPMKYLAQMPEGVRIMGPIHGTLFLGYCAFAFWVATQEKWPVKQQLLAYLAAVLPFGTLLFERKFLSAASSSRIA